MLRADVCTDIPQNLNPGQDTREQTTKRTHERRHEGTHEGAHQHRPTNQPATHATNQPPPSVTHTLSARARPPLGTDRTDIRVGVSFFWKTLT